MKNVLGILFVVVTLSSLANASDVKTDLVLEKIKGSIGKDFNIKEGYYIEETEFEKFKNISEEIEVTEDNYKKKGLTGVEKVDRQILENRLKMQKKQGIKSDKILTGKEKIALMLERNRQKIKEQKAKEKLQDKQDDDSGLSEHEKKMKSRLRAIDAFKNKAKDNIDNLIKERKKIISGWLSAQKKYHKDIPKYKKNSLNPSGMTSEEMKLIESEIKNRFKVKKVIVNKKVRYVVKGQKKVKKTAFKKVYVIPGALNRPVKNQWVRPTCSSFATVRAIEIVTANKRGKYIPLSEQYFYWLSKPSCQKRPCRNNRGSVALYGIKASVNSLRPDIPTEDSCPYSNKQISSNETQTPLDGGCEKGVVKVSDYALINAESEADLVNAIENNYPIIAGMELSGGYYKNSGYVFNSTKKGSRVTDSHASGHAMLFVGYMALPKKLHAKEGKVCYITTNSWGEGWGVGGHSCVSHKWMLKHMRNRPYKYYWAIKDVYTMNI